MKLGSTMLDLDKLADEVLAKSMTEDKKELTDNEVKPEDVSANIPDEDTEKPEETTTEEKEDREEPVKKSVEASEKTPEEEEKDAEEPIEKSEELEKEVEPEEKSQEEPEEEEKAAEPIEKSFKSDETIQKSIEASEFLSTLVELIVKSLTDTQDVISKSQSHSNTAFEIFAKSITANLQQGEANARKLESFMESMREDIKKSITDEISAVRTEILDNLNEFSHQPATMRKSMKSVNVHDKDFQKSLGNPEIGEVLSKAEVMATLTSELYSGNPLVTSSDIISYESGAPLRPEVQKLVMSKCK